MFDNASHRLFPVPCNTLNGPLTTKWNIFVHHSHLLAIGSIKRCIEWWRAQYRQQKLQVYIGPAAFHLLGQADSYNTANCGVEYLPEHHPLRVVSETQRVSLGTLSAKCMHIHVGSLGRIRGYWKFLMRAYFLVLCLLLFFCLYLFADRHVKTTRMNSLLFHGCRQSRTAEDQGTNSLSARAFGYRVGHPVYVTRGREAARTRS